MSNDTAIVRVFKLWAKIAMMVVDGKRDAKEVADVLQTILDGGPKKAGEESYLRLLGTITLAPTKGSVTIAEASDVFTGYTDFKPKTWETNVSSVDTPETSVDIHEMKKNGTFCTLFSSLGVDPRSLCFTEGQIVEFCRKYPHLLLRNGNGNFFLCEVNGELFVVRIAQAVMSIGQLKLDVLRFDDSSVWSADYQFRLFVRNSHSDQLGL